MASEKRAACHGDIANNPSHKHCSVTRIAFVFSLFRVNSNDVDHNNSFGCRRSCQSKTKLLVTASIRNKNSYVSSWSLLSAPARHLGPRRAAGPDVTSGPQVGEKTSLSHVLMTGVRQGPGKEQKNHPEDFSKVSCG